MRHVTGNKRMDRQGSTPLKGMGQCPACHQGRHENCTRRAWDDVLDMPTSCFCADTGHYKRERIEP